ncbi:MAG TPA: hypothetical protein K8V08_08345 [Brevibacterium senegalense]|uniref:Uncharacterized protein n=1 Tax=Brevibacterium senegalense TaxID=1033736 RepID=A0A921ME49_9MICO|nr:hypothetical protein [Brevibacterium senegalense]
MDTSIAFLLIAAVLFVVIVPTVLKRSAEKDEDAQPARVRTVDVERTQRCAVDASRPQLLRDEAHPARVELPAPAVPVDPTAPRLSLRAPRPALEVVDGFAQEPAQSQHGVRPHAVAPDADAQDLPLELPLAVGAAPMLDLSAPPAPSTTHETSAHDRAAPGAARLTSLSTMDVHLSHSGSSASDPMDATMTSSHRTTPRRVAAAAERMPRDLPADVRARLTQPGPQRTTRTAGGAQAPSRPGQARPQSPSTGTDARRTAPRTPALTVETRRRIRRLRAVLPVSGLAVVGLTLATLVCAGFVVFGSMPWGVPVVTAALGLAGLALVRWLNTEIRALRSGTAAEAPAPQARTRTSAQADRPARTPARTTGPARPAEAARTSARTSAPQRERLTAADLDAEPITADLPIVRETAAAHTPETNPTTEAAPASDERPAGRAAEDLTTAVGPAHDLTDADASAEDQAAEDTTSEDRTTDGRTAEEQATAASASPAPRTRSVFAGSAQQDGLTVAETLARRRSPGEWTPSVLPVPRYVEAEPAAPAEPAPVVADASSYSLTPADKESLAEQFAEELGYRPALADAAAPRTEDGPLGHGRTAIRGSGAPAADGTRGQGTGGRGTAEPAQLGDILARRRA